MFSAFSNGTFPVCLKFLSQLSILVVLTGVSVAVIQYLFTNHQAHLKDFIASLVKIDFDAINSTWPTGILIGRNLKQKFLKTKLNELIHVRMLL
jgi:ABC-type enterochelin transport system substrate-binding protein